MAESPRFPEIPVSRSMLIATPLIGNYKAAEKYDPERARGRRNHLQIRSGETSLSLSLSFSLSFSFSLWLQ